MKKIGILTKFKNVIEKKKKTAALDAGFNLDAVFNNIIAIEEKELADSKKNTSIDNPEIIELVQVDDSETIGVEELMFIDWSNEVVSKGFMEPNREYIGGEHLPMEFVSLEPEKYVINECLTACKVLWGKNIYTYSSSDYNDNYTSITILIDHLSPENMDILSTYINNPQNKFGVKVIKNGKYLEFRVDAIGFHAGSELLNLAGMFTIQDVPEKSAYLNISDINENYSWYLENLKPGYVVDGDSNRIYINQFHYYKHMRYVDASRIYEEEFSLKKTV